MVEKELQSLPETHFCCQSTKKFNSLILSKVCKPQSISWVICKHNSQIKPDLFGIALNGKENPTLFFHLCSPQGFPSSSEPKSRTHSVFLDSLEHDGDRTKIALPGSALNIQHSYKLILVSKSWRVYDCILVSFKGLEKLLRIGSLTVSILF